MNPFTRFSLNNTLVVGLLVVLITAAGLFYGGSMQMETMPNISLPVITIATIYPGASPEDISETISQPLQKSISGIQGLDRLDAISNENISLMVARFGFEKDIEKANREIEEAVARVTLPEKSQKPVISRIRMNSLPILTYSVSGTKSEDALRSLLSDRIRPALLGVPGVSSVSVDGIRDDKVYIKVDETKLRESNLTLQDLQQALAMSNIAFPAGNAEMNGQSLPVKLSSRIATLEDIKSIPMIAIPNTAKLTGEAMSKVTGMITQLYGAMAQMGSGMQKLGDGMKQLGDYTAKNSQAIALLAQIQQSQAMAMSKASVLANPNATQAEREEAQQTINVASLMGKAAGTKLAEMFAGAATEAAPDTQQTTPSPAMSAPKGQGKLPTATSSSALPVKIVFVGDVADVSVAKEEVDSQTRADGKPAIIVNVYKNDDANTVTVADGVKEKIKAITDANPKVNITQVSDSSEVVKTSVFGMLREGLLGALFAIVVIALFLGNFRATVIAVVSIPLSVLIALIVMPRFGITINSVSLAGIAVAVGRIVDDSIVVIENIHRQLHSHRTSNTKITMTQLIGSAVSEVSSAITSSTVTTVAVFLPLGLVSGMIGKFFVPFAITVFACILASLLVALTVVPVMSRLMMNGMIRSKGKNDHELEESKLSSGYKRILTWALGHRASVIIGAIVLVVVSLAMVPMVGIQFLPASNADLFTVRLEMPPGTTLDSTDSKVKDLEKFLLTDTTVKEKVDTITSSVGSGGSGGFIGNMQSRNQALVTVLLKDAEEAPSVMKAVKKVVEADNSKAKWTITAQSVTGTNENIEVLLTGDNLDHLRKASHLVTQEFLGIDKLENVTNNLSVTKPEISIQIDSRKAAAKGLSPLMVAGTVRSAFSFDKVTTARVNGHDLEVLMGYNQESAKNLETIKNLQVRGLSGAVNLSEVADIKLQDGPATITERDGKRNAAVTADITGSDTIEVINTATEKLDKIKPNLPKDVTVSIGGSSDMISEGFTQMGMAMVAAVILVFITMLLGLREPAAAFAILFSLPFAAVGALLALVATGNPVSMSGMVGILMLIGIVVTNAIVLMDRVLTNKASGMNITESLLEAGAVRLRPIIMTAAATVMALLPMALGYTEGQFIGKEVALVVIGGLVMSTILTLVIVPVAYSVLSGAKKRQEVPEV